MVSKLELNYVMTGIPLMEMDVQLIVLLLNHHGFVQVVQSQQLIHAHSVLQVSIKIVPLTQKIVSLHVVMALEQVPKHVTMATPMMETVVVQPVPSKQTMLVMVEHLLQKTTVTYVRLLTHQTQTTLDVLKTAYPHLLKLLEGYTLQSCAFA